MRRYNHANILTLMLVYATLFNSCEESGGDVLTGSSFVVISEATTTRGVVVTNFYEQRNVPTNEKFTIYLDSIAHLEDIIVSYSLTTTGEIGKHIEPLDLQGTVVIPAGSRSAEVGYQILTDNFSFGEQINFTIRLNQVSGGNARINVAYATFTNVIGIACTSDIPEGTYVETTDNTEVKIEKIDKNLYAISSLNFRYYPGPEYGEIPGEFIDQCGLLILQGKVIEDKYEVAWTGRGEWNSELQQMSFTVSDATYNPDYKIDMVFQYVP